MSAAELREQKLAGRRPRRLGLVQGIRLAGTDRDDRFPAQAAVWCLFPSGRTRRRLRRRSIRDPSSLYALVVEPDTRYALSGAVRVAYHVLGDGPRDLVLAPGFVSNLELAWERPSYERFMRRLATFESPTRCWVADPAISCLRPA